MVKVMYRNLRRFLCRMQYARLKKRQSTSRVEEIVENDVAYRLFVTNDNGGGTRQYENNVLKEENHALILRRMSYADRKDIMYEVRNFDTGRVVYLWEKELPQVFAVKLSSITLNTLVQTTAISTILAEVTHIKQENPGCRLMYLVHDFHAVCPNCNLFTNGHYCRLDCEKEHCEPKLADTPVKISEWRAMWRLVLELADEIRCFSTSSRAIMLQAYPGLEKEKVTVVPHDTSFIHFTPIRDVDKLPLHLGIVGDCTTDFKGMEQAKALIRRFGDVVPITMVGSSGKRYHLRRKKVSYISSYAHDELQHILEEKEISVAVFPSVCPETFSYVVSELMAMELPILCFDYGAQAERVSTYKKGIVCHDVTEMCMIIEEMRKRRAHEE